eukprot:3828213-Lingulodinium_polyedra.AAC.1
MRAGSPPCSLALHRASTAPAAGPMTARHRASGMSPCFLRAQAPVGAASVVPATPALLGRPVRGGD